MHAHAGARPAAAAGPFPLISTFVTVADYNPDTIERKWQRIWEERRCFTAPDRPVRPGFYCLEMLPYPSGRIHMGHVRNYAIGDAVARFMWMKGHDVLHPMGWDSFGMPAENAAIERGQHPKAWTESNISDMRGQLKRLGLAYDWGREIASHRPEYYRWNQWFFLRLHEKDLAYRSRRPVNWCPGCATVLANEQVEQGGCWRCGRQVEQKELDQWFLRISRYAEELLDDLASLEGWPEAVLTMQRNWIGRSEGAFVDFPVRDREISLRVFTTRIDTIYGATFMAVSPDHPALDELLEGVPEAAGARRFIEAERRVPASEKLTTEREKAGVFTGRHAVNPFNGEAIPIWIANFVLMEYGTGAIMAVPAHDERDHEFAVRYDLPVRRVIEPADGSEPDLPFPTLEGRTCDSGEFTGRGCIEAQRAMTDHAQARGFGEASVQYRLRDWGISRQRYWGTPIPMIHCPSCGTVPVPESALPVVLPEQVEFTGRGGSPLEASGEFVRVACPRCGGAARRETDTMDTFIDSSWYFYRYLDPTNDRAPFDPDRAKAWFPIDLYIGGITHAILHLMYARFFSMAMRDLGLATPAEPVTRLLCQGMVLKDGSAMSKSRGNVVAPEVLIDRYGADVTRLFILFAAPPERDLDWSDEGVEGLQRFARRVWRLIERYGEAVRDAKDPALTADPAALALRRRAHVTLRRVGDDIGRRLHLNTAIAAIMELVNAIYAFRQPDDAAADPPAGPDAAVLREAMEVLLHCLAPFAPHLAEEGWAKLGHAEPIARHPFPEPDPALLVEDEVTVVVQVNGKVRGRIQVPRGADEASVLEALRGDERLHASVFPDGSSVAARTIYVPDRILNVVHPR